MSKSSDRKYFIRGQVNSFSHVVRNFGHIFQKGTHRIPISWSGLWEKKMSSLSYSWTDAWSYTLQTVPYKSSWLCSYYDMGHCLKGADWWLVKACAWCTEYILLGMLSSILIRMLSCCWLSLLISTTHSRLSLITKRDFHAALTQLRSKNKEHPHLQHKIQVTCLYLEQDL